MKTDIGISTEQVIEKFSESSEKDRIGQKWNLYRRQRYRWRQIYYKERHRARNRKGLRNGSESTEKTEIDRNETYIEDRDIDEDRYYKDRHRARNRKGLRNGSESVASTERGL